MKLICNLYMFFITFAFTKVVRNSWIGKPKRKRSLSFALPLGKVFFAGLLENFNNIL